MTFAAALRSILRADPDVVLIGEIRDQETANIAIEASLTGHLVLSTLHTNDAPSAVTRLTEMGVEPFLVSSSLAAVMAQRLARRLCKKCKRMDTATEAEMRLMGVPHAPGTPLPTVYRPVGCRECSNTGIPRACGHTAGDGRGYADGGSDCTRCHFARNRGSGTRQRHDLIT